MDIPVVDLDSLSSWGKASASGTVADLVEAFSGIGFAFVTGHGVDLETLAALQDLLPRVFAADQGTKTRWQIDRENYRGYIPLEFFTPNRHDGTSSPDSYEGFKLHWECPDDHPIRDECPLYGSNRWPDHLPGMAEVVLKYWIGCDRLSATLLEVLADALGIDPVALLALFDAPLTNMTLLHYPPGPPTGESLGIHPHKDISAVTILNPDPAGGLDVQGRDGRWMEAVGPPEALLANVGDLLELWSGGRFVSTPHRVVNRTDNDRYSAPYFAVPNHGVVVEPLVEPVPGFRRDPIPVGEVSAEVWRTNWPDENPSEAGYHLGTLGE